MPLSAVAVAVGGVYVLWKRRIPENSLWVSKEPAALLAAAARDRAWAALSHKMALERGRRYARNQEARRTRLVRMGVTEVCLWGPWCGWGTVCCGSPVVGLATAWVASKLASAGCVSRPNGNAVNDQLPCGLADPMVAGVFVEVASHGDCGVFVSSLRSLRRKAASWSAVALGPGLAKERPASAGVRVLPGMVRVACMGAWSWHVVSVGIRVRGVSSGCKGVGVQDVVNSAARTEGLTKVWGGPNSVWA